MGKRNHKKIALFAAAFMLPILSACSKGQAGTVAPTETPNVSETVRIGGLELVGLNPPYYYDKNTKIVFLWNGKCHGKNNDTIPVPYPASNGLPFKYNETAKQMEEMQIKINRVTGAVTYE